MDYFHYFIHGAKVVAFFYDVLCELGPVICIFELIVMFPQSYSERATHLAYVFLIASWALQLVYSICVVLVQLLVFIHGKKLA
jgi:hypothetical protein